MSGVCHLTEGAGPLVVSIPHCGTDLATLDQRMTPTAQQMPDTDWHLPRLYDFLDHMDVTVIAANYSRYVIDLNREPLGKSLYPGQNVTELCPTTLFNEAPIYQDGQQPTANEISDRVQTFWYPYHEEIQAQLDRVKALHGRATLFDAHSIASHVPRFFEGRLPDFNLGTNDGKSCDAVLAGNAHDILKDAADYSAVLNGRFKGGYITRQYGAQDGVNALQLELSQITYMDESFPFTYDETKAGKVKATLKALAQLLAQ